MFLYLLIVVATNPKQPFYERAFLFIVFAAFFDLNDLTGPGIGIDFVRFT